jgi:hypothetical protein
MNPSRRCVGKDDINWFCPPQLEPESADLAAHFMLAVLIPVAVIPAGAGKTYEVKAPHGNDPAADFGTAGRLDVMADVVVAEDIEQWYFVDVSEFPEVFRGQIAAAKNQIDTGDRRITITVDKFPDNCIRDAEDLHVLTFMVRGYQSMSLFDESHGRFGYRDGVD